MLSTCVFALCGRVVGHDRVVRRVVGGIRATGLVLTGAQCKVLPTMLGTVNCHLEENDSPVIVQPVLTSNPQVAGGKTRVSCKRMLGTVKRVGSVTMQKATASRHVENVRQTSGM